MTNNLSVNEFTGQGLSFPLQISPGGGLALVAAAHDIEQAIRIILMTAPGEPTISLLET